MTSNRCPDCMEGLLAGSTGNCPHCDGTGVNAQLNAENPKCPFCGGSGRCATCGGTGIRSGGNAIQTLFGS
jgi:hypothetical protein